MPVYSTETIPGSTISDYPRTSPGHRNARVIDPFPERTVYTNKDNKIINETRNKGDEPE